MREYITNSENETEALAGDIAKKLTVGDCLAFSGGLGAGKTAFIRGLANGLGIGDEVSSPTFALAHEYRGSGKTLYHFDMYRIESWQELYSTGFFDYLDSGGILAVEWSENIAGALPEDSIRIRIEALDESKRRIMIEGGGGRF